MPGTPRMKRMARAPAVLSVTVLLLLAATFHLTHVVLRSEDFVDIARIASLRYGSASGRRMESSATTKVGLSLAVGQPQSVGYAVQLHDVYGVPQLIVDNMSQPMRKRLLGQLRERATAGVLPKTLIVHPQNGLGNRMRVLASAMAWVKIHQPRAVILVWERDVHMGAGFLDVFEENKDLVVVDSLSQQWPFSDARQQDRAWSNVSLYNYMDTEPLSNKNAAVVEDRDRHIYFRACEFIKVPGSQRDIERFSAHALKHLVPVPEVSRTLSKLQERYGKLSHKIGVHIRQMSVRSEFSSEFDASKEYGSESLKRMEYWRARSSVDSFIGEMRRILHKNPGANFFVATDSPAVLQELETAFPKKIAHLDPLSLQACENKRSAECVQLALVDLIALSKTKLLLGSHWSSFTNMVVKMGVRSFRKAGVDFAKA